MNYFKLVCEPYREKTKGFLCYEQELEEKELVIESNAKKKKKKRKHKKKVNRIEVLVTKQVSKVLRANLNINKGKIIVPDNPSNLQQSAIGLAKRRPKVVRDIHLERGYSHLIDSTGRRILTWLYPQLKPYNGQRYYKCASEAYINKISISAINNSVGNIVLKTYFTFTDEGLRNAALFLQEHDESLKKGHFYIEPERRNHVLYKGHFKESFFEVLYYKSTDETSLVLENIIQRDDLIKPPTFLKENRGADKRAGRRIEHTNEEINILFYKTLVRNYKEFPVLK